MRGYDFVLEKRAPELGEDVAVLGFPLGLPLSVSRGLVSGADRTVPIDGIKRRRLVQTDAAVNHGNSGGPLISLENGKVVGLVDIGTTQANGLAFAVSSQVAQPLLNAWAVSPQPIVAAGCEVEPQRNPVSTAKVAPPPAPANDAAVVKATINEHWSLVRQQRYEEAYDLFSPSFKSRVSREGWVNDKLRDRPKVSAIIFTSAVSVDGDTADVSVGFTTAGLETSSTNTGCNVWNGTYHLVRTGDTWLIDDSHLSRQSC
jgi:hypothetical protein